MQLLSAHRSPRQPDALSCSLGQADSASVRSVRDEEVFLPLTATVPQGVATVRLNEALNARRTFDNRGPDPRLITSVRDGRRARMPVSAVCDDRIVDGPQVVVEMELSERVATFRVVNALGPRLEFTRPIPRPGDEVGDNVSTEQTVAQMLGVPVDSIYLEVHRRG